MDAMAISRTGLDVEWRRLEIIAANLANASTTRTASGEAYRAMRLVSGPRAGFANLLSGSPARGRPTLDGDGASDATDMTGVMVYGIEPTNAEPRRVYEPDHPHANADGYVTYPAVDHAAEMTLMVRTARAYEANIVAMNSARQMYIKALDIGRRQ